MPNFTNVDLHEKVIAFKIIQVIHNLEKYNVITGEIIQGNFKNCTRF